MTQFVALDPKTQVNGRTVMAVVSGLGPDAQPILSAHGLAHVDPDGWYLQQNWLDVFRDIAEGPTNSMFDLVSIGMSIPANAEFPPNIDNMIAALKSIDVAYHMNHRGGEIGYYRADVINDREVHVVCENPYPCDFDYGIIYSMARRFHPAGMSTFVYHENEAGCRKHGGKSCTYRVVAR